MGQVKIPLLDLTPEIETLREELTSVVDLIMHQGPASRRLLLS
ncbi:hypothetical protein [Thermanaeromonas sp. C210]|nr:hypothetical protein [Thermanaeromonas sp. C210]GFN23905.1 hypothetical protein TAMC210_22220 [Thermanaeromonas sp. C210]